MKPWNKPIRWTKREHTNRFRQHDRLMGTDSRFYGITNWMVGTCKYPWSPWIQISFGYQTVQIKYYIIVILLMIVSFVIGSITL